MTDALAARLLAAIDTAEQLARAVPPGPWRADDSVCCVTIEDEGQIVETSCLGWSEYREHVVRYVVAQQPDAVLRRCAADRKILTEHQPARALTDVNPVRDITVCSTCAPGVPGQKIGRGRLPWPCTTLLALAEGYGITEETL